MPRQTTYSILLAGIIIVGGLLSLAVTPVGAVESYGIGAVPAHPSEDNPRTKSIFVYEAKTGSVTQDAVKLINNTAEEHIVKVYAVDSQHSSDGAFACAQAVDEKKDVGSWLVLEQNEVTLPPHGNQEVSFKVTVPPNAETGEHNGCIAIEDVRAPTQQVGNGIVLSFRSALRVAVTVPGKIQANLTFTNVLINDDSGKLVVSPVVKNTGNVSVDASVRSSLTTVFGNVVAESKGTFVVLNKDESRFNFNFERPFWGGWYSLQTEATYAILKEHPGASDMKQTARSETRSLFIAPNPTALFVYISSLVAIASVTIYLIWQRRRFKLMHQATVAYDIKPGDTLQALAEQAGINWRMLAKLNRLKPPYSLRSGQTLRIPKRRPKTADKSSKNQA